MKIGDLLTELPSCSYAEEIKITDSENIENGEFSIGWKPFEGAASYSVRAFFNINYMDKKAALNFLYEAEFKTDSPSVTVTDLQRERRYTIVVYALDSNGNEIAVYDRLHIFTFPEIEVEEVLKDNDSNNDSTVLIIAAAVVGGLIVVAVIVLIVVLIKTKKHSV